MQQLKQLGADWVMTYGDANYYAKVGFSPVSDDEPIITGLSVCVAAFNNPEIW